MEQINLPPFYVSQKIVALSDDINGRFKKGDIRNVFAIQKGCCEWEVDIGEKHNSWIINCMGCGVRSKPKDNVGWYRCRHFAPIQENFQSISLSEIAKEESKLISVN